MVANPRPRRAKKADRLTNPGAKPEDIRCDYAVGPFDEECRRMDRKWGVDRLPQLVSKETADRFAIAMSALNEALDARDPQLASDYAANAVRGLKALDAEAESLGATKADPEVWEYDMGGFKFAIIADEREWPELKARRPDLLFFTMREVGVALKALKFDEGGVTEIKKHFPGAQVTNAELPKSFWDNGGDETLGF